MDENPLSLNDGFFEVDPSNPNSGGVDMLIPRWGVEYRLHRDPAHRDSFQRSLGIIFDTLGLTERVRQ